uniref:Putative secreted protein n=1 Tax=Anopheles marajoara TaxID=58244 RepID=A0A2M4CD71_9DIPT
MPTPSPWPPLAMSCLLIIAERAAFVMVFTFARGATSGWVFDFVVPPPPPFAFGGAAWHFGVTSDSVLLRPDIS